MGWRGAGGRGDPKDSTADPPRGHRAGGHPGTSHRGCRHPLRGRQASPCGFPFPKGMDPSGAAAHPKTSAKSILHPSEPAGRVFKCVRHSACAGIDIDNNMCCFSPRGSGRGAVCLSLSGMPSFILQPRRRFSPRSPRRAVLRLGSGDGVALCHVAVGSRSSPALPAATLGSRGLRVVSARRRHPPAGTVGGFAEAPSAGAWGVTAAQLVYLETSRAKDVLPRSCSSAFPCPSFTAVILEL